MDNLNENQEYCPQCLNHCHKSELRCGKGRAYFGQLQTNSKEHNGHNFSSNISEEQSIIFLLRQCGHFLHHNANSIDNDKLCQVLSADEQRTLEDLLKKLLSDLTK